VITNNEKTLEIIRNAIRDVPDFPKPGILFKDITTLISNPEAFKLVTEIFANKFQGKPIDYIAAPEARGFIFGAPLSLALGAGLTLIRKSGKLPAKKISYTYDLEYGSDTLFIHEDAFEANGHKANSKPNVLIIDDLLATGGSSKASTELIRQLGANVISKRLVWMFFL
jgi:adenine phosphoribosyltransferase